jgi:hypothetical protein
MKSLPTLISCTALKFADQDQIKIRSSSCLIVGFKPLTSVFAHARPVDHLDKTLTRGYVKVQTIHRAPRHGLNYSEISILLQLNPKPGNITAAQKGFLDISTLQIKAEV